MELPPYLPQVSNPAQFGSSHYVRTKGFVSNETVLLRGGQVKHLVDYQAPSGQNVLLQQRANAQNVNFSKFATAVTL